MSEPTNDNGSPPRAAGDASDPHGRAALLLVESLIHGLIARAGLSLSEAIEIVESAIEVQNEISDGHVGDVDGYAISVPAKLLSAIANSLRVDQPDGFGPRIEDGGADDGAAV